MNDMVMIQITSPHMEPNRALARLLTLTYTLLPKTVPNTQIGKENAKKTIAFAIHHMLSIADIVPSGS